MLIYRVLHTRRINNSLQYNLNSIFMRSIALTTIRFACIEYMCVLVSVRTRVYLWMYFVIQESKFFSFPFVNRNIQTEYNPILLDINKKILRKKKKNIYEISTFQEWHYIPIYIIYNSLKKFVTTLEWNFRKTKLMCGHPHDFTPVPSFIFNI